MHCRSAILVFLILAAGWLLAGCAQAVAPTEAEAPAPGGIGTPVGAPEEREGAPTAGQQTPSAALTQLAPFPTQQAAIATEMPAAAVEATAQPEFFPTATPTEVPTWYFESHPTPEFTKPQSTLESHIVQVEWPSEMRLGESDTVRLTLIPSSQGFTLITEYPEHPTITETLTIERAPGYELFGIARLDAPGFELSPTGEQIQYLPESSQAQWRWSLTPQQGGRQRLGLTLTLRWQPLSGDDITRDVPIYSKSLEMRVHSFMGMTQNQALRTGLLSILLGAGLSLFAVISRPRPTEQRSRRMNPNSKLVLETPAGLTLSPVVRNLLQTLFRRYGRLVVESEFLSGYSGAQTFLVLPIHPDGRTDAYTIAKIGERVSIEKEYANYDNFVRDTLPPVTARIQRPPVTIHSGEAHRHAALQYTFIGQPGRRPISLRQAVLENPDRNLLGRLMDTFGPHWWLQRSPYTFRIGKEYDRLLPSHLVLAPAEGRGLPLDGRLPPSMLSFQVGDRVQIQHFNRAELRGDGRSWSLAGMPTPGYPPIRIRWISPEPPGGQAGQVIDTRYSMLEQAVLGMDRYGLPDPLEKLPEMLGKTLNGSRSIIHGDLNVENILVGPGGMLWLIDFASTREGPPLMDFSHLAAEMIAHVLAPKITSPEEYFTVLKEPVGSPWAAWAGLLDEVNQMASRCLFNPDYLAEYDISLVLACLGALKYSNLDAHARHLLYVTAAHTYQKIIEPGLNWQA